MCSRYFVNGDKSNIATHPGYLPTIFPPVYKKQPTVPAAQLSRFNRWRKRSSVGSSSTAPAMSEVTDVNIATVPATGMDTSDAAVLDTSDAAAHEGLNLLCAAAEVHKGTRSVGTQTEDTDTCSKSFSVFICCIQETEASTQVMHHETRDCSVQHKPDVASRHSGADQRTGYFAGYDPVAKSASALEGLCSVSRVVFALLLSMLPVSSERKSDVSMENSLLLCLMKLKLGISYSSLAVIFSINETTASRHFKSVLKTLAVATKKCIFRPPARVIQATMPDSFKLHYPGCTMIIDCT
ncbi:unnamed protein product [Ixodes hexagonus]